MPPASPCYSLSSLLLILQARTLYGEVALPREEHPLQADLGRPGRHFYPGPLLLWLVSTGIVLCVWPFGMPCVVPPGLLFLRERERLRVITLSVDGDGEK